MSPFISQDQNKFKINLEFGIIVAMTLLVLSYQLYIKYQERLLFWMSNTFYWSVVAFAVLIHLFAVAVVLRNYYYVFMTLRDKYEMWRSQVS